MIKANIVRAEAVNGLQSSDIELVAQYLTEVQDSERGGLLSEIEQYRDAIRESERTIENKERDIRENRERIERCERAIAEAESKIAQLPARRVVPSEEANADIARAVALPFIKSVKADKDTDGRACLIFQTRENALYTTFSCKYSRAERWYRAKAYRVPLPAYTIRVGLRSYYKSCALESKALGLMLADYAGDTAHWLPWIRKYNQEPHPHWGTTSSRAGSGDPFNGVCLGEYEGEVSNAFTRSIAEGLTAFAVYLQTAGSAHAYISRREVWGLLLGKKEYNAVLVPSEKEIPKLEEESTELCSNDTCELDENGDYLVWRRL